MPRCPLNLTVGVTILGITLPGSSPFEENHSNSGGLKISDL
jgi:hypothetical protein